MVTLSKNWDLTVKVVHGNQRHQFQHPLHMPSNSLHKDVTTYLQLMT